LLAWHPLPSDTDEESRALAEAAVFRVVELLENICWGLTGPAKKTHVPGSATG